MRADIWLYAFIGLASASALARRDSQKKANVNAASSKGYEEEPLAYGVGPKPYGEDPKPYGEEHKPYEDPKPAYTDPKPAYTDPKPAYTDPKPAYEDPKPAYEDPKPAYEDPKPYEAPKAYGDAKPYEDPKPYGDEHKPYDDKPEGYGDEHKPYDDEPKGYGDEHKPYDDEHKPYDDDHKPYDDEPKGYGDEPKGYGDEPKGYGDEHKPYDDEHKPYGDEPEGYGDEHKPYEDDSKPKPYGFEDKGYGDDHKSFDDYKPKKAWRPKTRKPEFFSLRVDDACQTTTDTCPFANFAIRLEDGIVIATPYNKWWDPKLPIFFVDDDTKTYTVSRKPLQLYVNTISGALRYAPVGYLPPNSIALSFYKTGDNPLGKVDPSPSYFAWPTTEGRATPVAPAWWLCPLSYTGQYQVFISNVNFGNSLQGGVFKDNCQAMSLAAINASPWGPNGLGWQKEMGW